MSEAESHGRTGWHSTLVTELEDESLEIWGKYWKSSWFSKKLNLVSWDPDYENDSALLFQL